jgi:transcriptional regulator NrdR family protein
MKCPFCGSKNYERYRSPRIADDDVLLRRHRCLSCRGIFLTAEIVVTGKLALRLARIEDLL